jgi:hypothetical protein
LIVTENNRYKKELPWIWEILGSFDRSGRAYGLGADDRFCLAFVAFYGTSWVEIIMVIFDGDPAVRKFAGGFHSAVLVEPGILTVVRTLVENTLLCRFQSA